MLTNAIPALPNEDQQGEKLPAAPRRRGPKVDIALSKQRNADIMREAARLIDQVGYHSVNMEMIAEAAGLKKPTLYHYIKSKDDILFKIQYEMIQDLREKTATRIAEGMDPYHLLQGIYEQAEEFRPERFLDGDQPDSYSWIPFGGGRRRCIGAAFVTMEMKAVLAEVLTRVEVRAQDPRPEHPLSVGIFVGGKWWRGKVHPGT